MIFRISAPGGEIAPKRHQLIERQLVLLELADGERRSVDGERRGDDVDAGAVDARRASQIGELSSTRRPIWLTMRWQMFISCALSRKRMLVSWILPATSM